MLDPALRSELENIHASLSELTFYELLGVGEDASTREIRDAFHKKAQRFHADAYAGTELGPLRHKMETVFGELSRAHATLTDFQAREEYDAGLRLAERGVPTDVRKIFAADQAFRDGKRMLDRGSFREAYEKFREATDTNPSEPDFWAGRHWAAYGILDTDAKGRQVEPARAAKIQSDLEKLVEENEHCALAAVYLGHILRNQGESELAMKAYKRALRRDPENLEAKSGLRLLAMRKKKSGGFLAKLFGKK